MEFDTVEINSLTRKSHQPHWRVIMYKLLAVILLSLSLSVPALGAEPHQPMSSSENFNKNLAMLGGGMLGIVLASGAIGLASSGAMMFEGAGFAEAMESGAGLTMPVVFLTTALGAVFGQDFVLRNIHNYSAGASEPAH